MYEVPVISHARRRAPTWLRQLPLILAALAILGSVFRPWIHHHPFIKTTCTDLDCSSLIASRDIPGKDLPYAPDILTLAITLALHGAGLARQRRRAVEIIKMATLGLAMAWQIMLYRAIHRLGYGPLLNFDTQPAIPWGHYCFAAGMALLGLGLLLSAARLLRPGRAPATPEGQVAPLQAKD